MDETRRGVTASRTFWREVDFGDAGYVKPTLTTKRKLSNGERESEYRAYTGDGENDAELNRVVTQTTPTRMLHARRDLSGLCRAEVCGRKR